jgi:hypothetical protein
VQNALLGAWQGISGFLDPAMFASFGLAERISSR